MPLTVPEGKAKGKAKTKAETAAAVDETKVANEKAKAEVEATQEVKENVDNSKLETLCTKLALVAPLGDPSVRDKTIEGGVVKRDDPTIVGYRFKAEVDLEVPDVMPGADFKENLMSCSGDLQKTRLVKAGTEFDLTKFETGLLIARDEFNSKVLGGNLPVYCVYQTTGKKDSAGVLKTSSTTAIPSVSLRSMVKGTSIKDIEMIPVLSFTTEKTEAGVVRYHKTINKGFEKWENLCKEKPRTGGGVGSRGGNSGEKALVRNKGAEAFLSIVNSRK